MSCGRPPSRGVAAGGAFLGGGTQPFSEPQPQIRRLIDLSRVGREPLRVTAGSDLEIAATWTKDDSTIRPGR